MLWPMLCAVGTVLEQRGLFASTGVTADTGPELEVALFVVRDGDMVDINRNGLGLTGPTNVLSFPSGQVEDASLTPGGEPSRLELGELYLSTDTLAREALLYGQNPEEHARRLLAHGLAHLLGYDHGNEMDAVCETLLG